MDWELLLMGACVTFVGVFMLVDRWRQRRRRPAHDGTLRACTEASLAEVEHQIWLLRNIFWWYLLPCLIGGLGLFCRSRCGTGTCCCGPTHYGSHCCGGVSLLRSCLLGRLPAESSGRA